MIRVKRAKKPQRWGSMLDLRLCDARDGLATLGDDTIDMIFTDPPYPTISGGAGQAGDGSPSGMLAKNDGKIFEHNDIGIEQYASELYRVLKSPGHAYVMCNLLNLWQFHSVLTDVGFKVHNLLSWRKNTCTPNRWGMKNGEYIFLLRKGPARSLYNPSLKMIEDVNVVPYHSKTHPTEKPVDLIKQYVEASSQKGEVVLDPFMGTGSTGTACRAMGRRFIGFELSPEYFGAACSRLNFLPGLSNGSLL